MIEHGKSWRYSLESQHLSGNPKIFGKDIDLMRRMALEAIFSTGITVDFYRCCEDKSDMYQDPKCVWDDAVQISAIFEDNPKIKVLKDLGWYTEDEEIRPQIIYIPMYKDWTMKELFDVKSNSLIHIHYFGQEEPREFRITEKKMDSVYGVYWICKLAPERLDNFYTITLDGTHYLKRNLNRGSSCEHKENDSGEDLRVYNHDDYENNIGMGTDRDSNTSNNFVSDYSQLVMGGN